MSDICKALENFIRSNGGSHALVERLNPFVLEVFTAGYQAGIAHEKAAILKMLESEEMVDIVSGKQANGWEYGTHPREKANIVLTAIRQKASEL